MITVALVCHPGVAVGDAHSHRKAAENLLIVMEVDKSFPKLAEQLVESQLKQNPQLTPHRDVFQRFFTKYLNWAQVKEDTITHTGHIRSGMHRAQRAWYPARVIGQSLCVPHEGSSLRFGDRACGCLPPVWLDASTWVANSCQEERGPIKPRVAYACARYHAAAVCASSSPAT